MKSSTKTAKPFRVSGAQWIKREFDATNRADLVAYSDFLKKSQWKNGCPFILEWPFTDVVGMIKHKIVEQHIAQLITRAK